MFTKKAVVMRVLERVAERDSFVELSRFRTDFYGCLSARADAFFELTDALLCADGPVKTPVELSLTAEHRRGYGSLYGAMNHGGLDVDRLRDLLVSLPLPRFDGRLVLTVDVSPWLRSDAACAPERLFCHVHGRSRAAAQIIPGWPYSFIAALTPDRTSWTAVLDAVRLGPADDAAAVTADQLRQVTERLITAGQWRPGDRDMLIVMDAGYDVMRLAWLLRDLPIELVGRLRSDRNLRLPAPPRVYQPKGGRPPKHGKEFRLAKPETWPEPPAGRDGERHAPLRQGRGSGMGPAPPGTPTTLRLDRPRQRTPHHRGHADPPQGRSPAGRPRRATGVAVVLCHRGQPGRHRFRLVVLPAKIRPGAHIPPVQTDARLDPAAAA